MLGIGEEVIKHRLNISLGAWLVKLKKSIFSSEKYQAIAEELDWLLAIGLIRETQYPKWLSNVVLVKKFNRKWRMCVDFTNLNKACLEDSFPLSRIDLIVDATAGHKM